MSSLNLFSCGRSTLARATVSTIVGLHSMPSSAQFRFIKLMSKSALWATIIQPLQNSINCGSMTSTVGDEITISSLIEVSSSILNGIGTSGFINVEYLSTISPPMTFTAPISMILFFSGEKPVVSISNTTYLSSSDCPAAFSTISFVSSTRYASTP